MKYLEIIGLLAAVMYPLSYAKYNIVKKNYLGALGMILLALAAIGFPTYLILIR